jgi:hypothetical protein
MKTPRFYTIVFRKETALPVDYKTHRFYAAFSRGKNVPYYVENMLLSHCHPSEDNLADFLKHMLESIIWHV